MNIFTAKEFKQMLESGANHLTNKHREIDALNVFPVPDGDTGTNMNLTFSAGAAEALRSNSDHLGEISKVLSKGLLMGARGNSGVILSQIFRGFSNAVIDKEVINGQDLAQAFDSAKEVAYKAVMRPVEGTILTVLRLASQATLTYAKENTEVTALDVLTYFYDQAVIALNKTPEMLPVLKEVGVVDSGGAGFVTILEGFLSAANGKVITSETELTQGSAPVQAQFEHEEFGYCTEFIVQLNEKSMKYFNEANFRNELEKLGNSLVVVQDEDIVKVHVHTLSPGDALNLGQRYGEFVKLKIENMAQQHQNLVHDTLTAPTQKAPLSAAKKEFKETCLVSVSAGEGLAHYFKDLRVDVTVSGGQTMNPSTQDFMKVIDELNCKNVIILPNNSNIVMAAKQCIELCEDKNVVVLETKTIPEGLSACIAYNPEVSLEENIESMQGAVKATKSGQVTYAVKDTMFENMEIKAGQYMGIAAKKIIVSTENHQEALEKTVETLVSDDSEIITAIVGENGDQELIETLSEKWEDEFDVEVEVIQGDQPVYSYIIGVE